MLRGDAGSDLEQRVGLAVRLRDLRRDVEDRDAPAWSALVGAVVGVAVEDRANGVEAVDGLGQARAAEEREDRLGLAGDGGGDRGVVQDDDGALGLQLLERVLEAERLVQHLLHEGLDRLPRRTHRASGRRSRRRSP